MNNFYKFTAAKDDNSPARLDLFGEVGGGFWSAGFDESTFKASLDSLGDEGRPLNVYVNSPGGSVFTALAIRTMLSRYKGKVTITVAGMAASAATIITCATNAQVIMPKGSMMLVHPVRLDGGSMTADEMRAAAESLDKVKQSVRDVYIEKTGMDEAALDELMSKESYLTAEEAVELGFADVVDKKKCVKNCIKGDYAFIGDLRVSASLFANAPSGFIAKEKERKTMTLDELRAEFPELVEQIKAEALKEATDAAIKDATAKERERIMAIDAMALKGQAELVQKAKFETPMTVEQFAIESMKALKLQEAQEAERKTEKLKAIENDASELKGLVDAGNAGVEMKTDNEKDLVAHLASVCKFQ